MIRERKITYAFNLLFSGKGLFFAVVLSYSPIFAQIFGELLPGSSKLTYDERTGIHKLLDGANFVYQGNTLYCDSALYSEKDQTIRAYGRVHIRKSDNINLFCDSLYYYPQTEKADLWGNVRAINEQYRLSTDSMTYDTKNEQGSYKNGGKIENLLHNEVLTSIIGYFYPKKQQYFFQTNVHYFSDEMELTTDSLQFHYANHMIHFYGTTCIITPSAILEAQRGWYNTETESGSLVKQASIDQQTRMITGDSLVYLPQKKISEGFGQVYVYDTIDKMAFSGNYALIDDSAHYSLLTDRALATKFQEKDTIYIHADTIHNINDTLGNRLLTHAYHDVKLLANSFQGMGDSLSYEKKTGCMELHKKPLLWAKNGELKGDSLRILLDDTIVQQVNVIGKATAIMQLDSGKYYNQIGGNEIIAYFENNQVTKARIIGNAQTIFFPEEKTTHAPPTDTITEIKDTLITNQETVYMKRIGMNRFFASDITVYFEGGEVSGITYYQQPDGVFYPMNTINTEEMLIQNFSTNFKLRPQSVADLFKNIKPEETQQIHFPQPQ